jgi:multicomponent Na+:H+ antiporter subunit E
VRIAGRLALLVTLWLLAWGQISVANLVSGVAVAAALLLAFPAVARPGSRSVALNPAGVARLVGYVSVQLVTSNVVMAREILRPHPDIRPGVLAHRLQAPSEEIVMLMTSVIALSPGTMTVDVDPASTTIYVHFLFLRDGDSARASLDRLERIVSGAFTARDPDRRSPASRKESS